MTAQTTTPRTRVALQNVGCKLNHYEIEALKDGFDRRGYEIVPFDAQADVYVVNTCTVTGSGDADSRKAVRRARRVNPGATVVATGCYAQRRPDEMSHAGAHLTIGNGQKADLLEHLEAHLQGRSPVEFDPQKRPRTRTFLQIDGAVEQGRTRGSLQIQDGCDEHCTYCIIPKVRGGSVSRPMTEILQQARRMVDAGYRELALTGVHSGSYGYDEENPQALVSLLADLERVEGLERIRLNSVEPAFLSDALIDYAASSTKFCRHFHVPLQSGDDFILKRMGRRYNRSFYADRIEKIAAQIPDCAIGADVMVGFPGEQEEHFSNSCQLLDELPVTYLHVFSFSLREGTPAAHLDEHQPNRVKKDRAHRLIELGNQKRLAFHRSFVDRQLEILVEERRDRTSGLSVGLSDNYVKVLFPTEEEITNQLLNVRVIRPREDLVFAERA